MGRLDDKVSIITGAARGLGAGIARRFAAEGAIVVCADILDASDTAASLPPSASGVPAKAVHLDVTDTPLVEEVINGVAEEHGRLDVLVNNAGVAQPILQMIDSPDEVFEKVFAVNVRGVLACSRAAGHIMKRQGSGRIINTASQTGKRAWPGWGVYSASKFAVVGMTQVFALELAEFGVTVNAICPGTMHTDMTKTGFGMAAEQEGRDRDEMITEHAKGIPMGRLGTGDDIGALAAFLASDDAAFTTGASINLTGGEEVFF
jgi:3-oxoacyl-[acyl-carrier protein] reductase/sorbitol-6-phosphate 2-dehydrogenase